MKLSLLDMTQDILSDMDSDEVNSIFDTIESTQVANIIKSTYFEIINNKEWDHLYKLFALNASGTTARPTHMKLPVEVREMQWIKYNKRRAGETQNRFEDVIYKTQEDFLRITNAYNIDNDNVVQVQDVSGIPLQIKTDRAPTYWTSFDDENIVFDSYDIEVDSTLQESKVQAYAIVSPSWSQEDSFVPDLPIDAFPHLLAEAKSVCFSRLKQVADPKAEQQSRRQRRWLAQKGWSAHPKQTYPNYGRRSQK